MEDGQREQFIGREKEIALFKEWLTNPNPEAPWILYFYDALEAEEKKGGVGKTWLLKHCATQAKELYPDIVIVPIDFFNVEDRDGVVVAERVANALEEAYPYWSPTSFKEILNEYRNTIREGKQETAEIRNRLADALTAELHKLDEQIAKEHRYLLTLFDTYELVERNPIISVLRLSQTFPDNYHLEHIGVVIAGRHNIDWSQPNWKGREHEVQSAAISPFSRVEMLQYFEKLADVEIHIRQEQGQALFERTEGRPILVALVNDLLNNRIMSLDELVTIPKALFESSLLAKINNLAKPIDSVIMFMAHAYHRFNFSLLDWILRETKSEVVIDDKSSEELSQRLFKLSFVRRPSSGNDFVLHDEMRPLVIKHCWEVQDPDLRLRKEISKAVVKYYERELSSLQREEFQQAYTVAILYHKLFIDLNEGYQYFKRHFSLAIDLWLTAFARSLLQETQKFISGMSPEQKYEIKLAEAQIRQKEENSELALALYQELEQEADQQWLKNHRADILYEKGVCYLQLSNFSEAIACFTASMEIEKELGHMSDYASLLNWLGYIYRRQGQLDKALQYYEESCAIHRGLDDQPLYANDLNSISNVYRLQGKVEEALRRSAIGWRIRYDLFKQGKMSEIYVGWSLSTIGAIYFHIDDLARAEDYFKKAYDIFTRTGHKKGIAAICNRFGQMDMARGRLTEAMQWFNKAYNTSLGIDIESQINSLNKKGWILALGKQWEEATAVLYQAIDLAKYAHDDYQEAESLVDIADVLERMGQHEQSQQALKEAEQVIQKYNYHYLLGLARESQADIRFSRGEYQTAFQYYGEACKYMASYNSIKYNRTLRKVINALIEVPREYFDAIVDSLITYWISQGLDKDYPELVNSCEEVRRLVKM